MAVQMAAIDKKESDENLPLACVLGPPTWSFRQLKLDDVASGANCEGGVP
jgi:hypothetical protein